MVDEQDAPKCPMCDEAVANVHEHRCKPKQFLGAPVYGFSRTKGIGTGFFPAPEKPADKPKE